MAAESAPWRKARDERTGGQRHHSWIGALVKDQAVGDRLQPGDIAGDGVAEACGSDDGGASPDGSTRRGGHSARSGTCWSQFGTTRSAVTSAPQNCSNARQART